VCMKPLKKNIIKYLSKLEFQRDKIYLVTGTGGLGLELIRYLCYLKATVIMAGRNPKKACQAIENVQNEISGAKIIFEQVDLSNIASVSQLIDNIKMKYKTINGIVCNAGVYMLSNRIETIDGLENHFQTNFLAHYYLTKELIPLLKDNKEQSKIVFVSSIAAYRKKLNFNDLQIKNNYLSYKAYARSKLALSTIAGYFNNEFIKNKENIRSVMAHPGISPTNLFKNYKGLKYKILHYGFKIVPFIKHSPQWGAMPLLQALISQNDASFGPRGLFEFRGKPKEIKIKGFAGLYENQALLSQKSDELILQILRENK